MTKEEAVREIDGVITMVEAGEEENDITTALLGIIEGLREQALNPILNPTYNAPDSIVSHFL